MPYVYLILAVVTCSSSSICGKLFHKQVGERRDSGIFYNFMLLVSVFIGWGVLFAVNPSFESGVLIYSALFAACYAACQFGTIRALEHGPATLTALFNSLSLILTAIWGLIFWDAPLTFLVVAGLVLVVCSITLCVYTKSNEEKSISAKWLFYVTLAFLGNAGCSIVQRTQQMQYSGQHGNMLMLFAMGQCALLYLVIYLRSDKSDTKPMLKRSGWVPVCAGVCNLVLNLMAILMASTDLSPSLIYPLIGVGGLSIVTVFSLLVFKEKMSRRQWLGVAIGAVAVVLLSL